MEGRLSGFSFSQLSEEDRDHAVDQIIFNACALCGCPQPQTTFFASVISKELNIIILDYGYEELTLQELFTALRINATGKFINPSGEDIPQVQFFGNCIHVTYLASIFKAYKILRTNLDNKFLNKIKGH